MAPRTTVATTEAMPRVIDVQALIDAAPVSSLQKRLLFLCFLVIAVLVGRLAAIHTALASIV